MLTQSFSNACWLIMYTWRKDSFCSLNIVWRRNPIVGSFTDSLYSTKSCTKNSGSSPYGRLKNMECTAYSKLMCAWVYKASVHIRLSLNYHVHVVHCNLCVFGLCVYLWEQRKFLEANYQLQGWVKIIIGKPDDERGETWANKSVTYFGCIRPYILCTPINAM